jgi:hypothetical protein
MRICEIGAERIARIGLRRVVGGQQLRMKNHARREQQKRKWKVHEKLEN